MLRISLSRPAHFPRLSYPAMASHATSAYASAGGPRNPVVLLDVMDTVVADPFFTHMAPYFGMSFQELLKAKHPSAWVEFENGLITEDQLFNKFFADGRQFDSKGLVDCIVGAYRYVDGMPELLGKMAEAGYEMHACSNYPMWHRYIENKLNLGKYLEWTFLSCEGAMQGLRKPNPAAFEAVIKHLGRPAEELLFVDDREVNVNAAAAAGMQAIHFQGAEKLEEVLREKGLIF